MKADSKGLGWILLGILLALLSLGGPLYLVSDIFLSADALRLLAVACGLAGLSYLYLRDIARIRNQE